MNEKGGLCPICGEAVNPELVYRGRKRSQIPCALLHTLQEGAARGDRTAETRYVINAK
jgi:hypothetical protein